MNAFPVGSRVVVWCPDDPDAQDWHWKSGRVNAAGNSRLTYGVTLDDRLQDGTQHIWVHQRNLVPAPGHHPIGKPARCGLCMEAWPCRDAHTRFTFEVGGRVTVYNPGHMWHGSVGEVTNTSNPHMCHVLIDGQSLALWFNRTDLIPISDAKSRPTESKNMKRIYVDCSGSVLDSKEIEDKVWQEVLTATKGTGGKFEAYGFSFDVWPLDTRNDMTRPGSNGGTRFESIYEHLIQMPLVERSQLDVVIVTDGPMWYREKITALVKSLTVVCVMPDIFGPPSWGSFYNEATQPTEEGEVMFRLFTVAAFNPEDGKIVLEPKVISAKDQQHAERVAVAEVVKADAKQDLDSIRIEAVPFGTGGRC